MSKNPIVACIVEAVVLLTTNLLDRVWSVALIFTPLKLVLLMLVKSGVPPVADMVVPTIVILFPAIRVGCTFGAVMLVALRLVADRLVADRLVKHTLDAFK